MRNWDRYDKGRFTAFPTIKEQRIEINWKFMEELLRQRSCTGKDGEQEMAYWLMFWLTDYCKTNPDVKWEVDQYNNFLITKGITDVYPCAVSHYDINQPPIKDYSIIHAGDWVMGVNHKDGQQCGLGFDDKAGMYFCFEMLDRLPECKIAFFYGEERGCIGSSRVDPNFFANCSMILQLDRNSYDGPEFISFTNGIEVCSARFIRKAAPVFDKYGYHEAEGMCTDVGAIKDNDIVNCIAANIGCGYYDEHRSNEVLHKRGFENAVNFSYELLLVFGHEKQEHYSHKPKPAKVKDGKQQKLGKGLYEEKQQSSRENEMLDRFFPSGQGERRQRVGGRHEFEDFEDGVDETDDYDPFENPVALADNNPGIKYLIEGQCPNTECIGDVYEVLFNQFHCEDCDTVFAPDSMLQDLITMQEMEEELKQDKGRLIDILDDDAQTRRQERLYGEELRWYQV